MARGPAMTQPVTNTTAICEQCGASVLLSEINPDFFEHASHVPGPEYRSRRRGPAKIPRCYGQL